MGMSKFHSQIHQNTNLKTERFELNGSHNDVSYMNSTATQPASALGLVQSHPAPHQDFTAKYYKERMLNEQLSKQV